MYSRVLVAIFCSGFRGFHWLAYRCHGRDAEGSAHWAAPTVFDTMCSMTECKKSISRSIIEYIFVFYWALLLVQHACHTCDVSEYSPCVCLQRKTPNIITWARSASMGCELAPKEAPPGMELGTFAGGCFWGLELQFQREPGVVKTTVGYTRGQTANPTYEQVCSGRTGHTEAVQVRAGYHFLVCLHTLRNFACHHEHPISSLSLLRTYRMVIPHPAPAHDDGTPQGLLSVWVVAFLFPFAVFGLLEPPSPDAIQKLWIDLRAMLLPLVPGALAMRSWQSLAFRVLALAWGCPTWLALLVEQHSHPSNHPEY
jgi:hypothetical protein